MSAFVQYVLVPLIGIWAAQQLIREIIATFREAKEGLWN